MISSHLARFLRSGFYSRKTANKTQLRCCCAIVGFFHSSQTNSEPLVCLFRSILVCRPHPRNLFVAPGRQGEAPPRDAEEGRVLRRAAQSFGENVPEAEIHQQTRQEETGLQAGPERLAGKSARLRPDAPILVRNLCAITHAPLSRPVLTPTSSCCCSGENLVPEPADEVEEFQGARAAVVGRLPRADAAHQSQPAPRSERRRQEELGRRRGGRGRGVWKRELQGGGGQHLLPVSLQQTLGLLRVRRGGNHRVVTYENKNKKNNLGDSI